MSKIITVTIIQFTGIIVTAFYHIYCALFLLIVFTIYNENYRNILLFPRLTQWKTLLRLSIDKL